MFPTMSKDDIENSSKMGTNPGRSDAKHIEGDIRDDLEAAACKAGRRVREYVDSASDEFTHMTDSLKSQIRTKPVQSSLIALAAGFVLGALLRR